MGEFTSEPISDSFRYKLQVDIAWLQNDLARGGASLPEEARDVITLKIAKKTAVLRAGLRPAEA